MIYIRDFVKKIGGTKVSYDGKNFILYADPRQILHLFFLIACHMHNIWACMFEEK
jgi:hypothetical protein